MSGARFRGLVSLVALVVALGSMLSAASMVFAAELSVDALQQRLEAAASKRLNVMVPDSYDEAQRYVLRAKEKLEKSRSASAIQRDLQTASVALDKVDAAAATAQEVLTPGMQARDDAFQAQAHEHNAKGWDKAESVFRGAASQLERGRTEAASKRLVEAVEAFRALELAAIKANYLEDTARDILAAGDANIDRYAPKTIARARTMITEASQALTKDRYDTDRPRSLARDANYEAKHANYIAREAKSIDDEEQTVEDLLLDLEQPFRTIAGELDIVIDQSEGPASPTADIVQAINYLKAEIRDLGQQLADKDQQIAVLQGQAEERDVLADKIRQQDERRARFERIEKMFDAEEAGVFRSADDVTLRLTGLPFASGKAVISESGFPLLAKVRDAIAVFPGASIEIEGHTDSFGSDDGNLVLSQERAESVRAYLLANMPALSPTAVQAFGYGESRPIANNESEEGRAKNRRIDLLIKP